MRSASSRLLLLVALASAEASCLEPVETERRARALGGSDAAVEAGPGCGPISYRGCCEGQIVWYCVNGELMSKVCGPWSACGWSAAQRLYTCMATAAADPSGAWPRVCSQRDAGRADSTGPQHDLHRDASGPPLACGALGFEGCCQGTMLHFCQSGQVFSLDCKSAPLCGWSSKRGVYDCATSGGGDPAGQHPRSCPAGLADGGLFDVAGEGGPDQGALDHQLPDAVSKTADARTGRDAFVVASDRPKTADAPSIITVDAPRPPGLDPSRLDAVRTDLGSAAPEGGCSCALPGARRGGRWLSPALLGLALALARRARRRR